MLEKSRDLARARKLEDYSKLLADRHIRILLHGNPTVQAQHRLNALDTRRIRAHVLAVRLTYRAASKSDRVL